MLVLKACADTPGRSPFFNAADKESILVTVTELGKSEDFVFETRSYCISLAGLELAFCRPGWFQTHRYLPASVFQMFLSGGLKVREWSGPFACYEDSSVCGLEKDLCSEEMYYCRSQGRG